jgi:hypothetical protein
MSVDFFAGIYPEAARVDALFGLCDDGNNTKAYSNSDNSDKWIATVVNENKRNIRFTPIDNNIIVYKENSTDHESLCDGMLTFTDTLYFAELKDKKDRWMSEGKQQLISTIKIFNENHPCTPFKHKKAFICNKRYHHFQVIDNEENKQFFTRYGFRLDINAKIKIN